MIDWLGGPLTLAEEQFLAVSGFLLAIFIFGKFMEIREAKKKHQEWKKIGLEISCSENVSGAT
jgi:hypothetical protein